MYDRFYKLSVEPFRLSPDHAFAFEHKHYSKARAYMAYAFLRAEGFVMVTGRPGTGKTTLIGSLVDQLAGENVVTANLVCTQLQADDLLQVVAYEFGLPTRGVSKGELLRELAEQLKSWHREGRRALLVVDEAQDLSGSAMEELRLLTNVQLQGKPLLQIFLLGQPELRDLILSPAMEQVHQRIVAASHLQPLLPEETEAYIRHRLEVAGWQDDPEISRAVYPLLHKFSGGIPRRINLICSRLFLHCAVEQSHRVTVADVREVLSELQGEDLAAGPAPGTADFLADDEFDGDDDNGAGQGPRPPAPPAPGDAGAASEPPARGPGSSRGRAAAAPVTVRQQSARTLSDRAGQARVRAATGPEDHEDEDSEAAPRPASASTVVPLRQDADAGAPAARAEARGAGRPAPAKARPTAATRAQDAAVSETVELRGTATEGVDAPVHRRRAAQDRTEPGAGRGVLLSVLLVAVAVAIVGWAASGFWPLGTH